MKTLRDTALRLYFSVRNSWPVWHGILNRTARMHYERHAPDLSPVQQRVIDDLKRDGIAFTSLEELFPGENVLATLQADMEARGKMEGFHRKKQFLQSFWDEYGNFGFDNPFFSLALRKEILAIVNSYDRMWRRLNHLHLQETIPVGDSTPTQSQRWHRDPQEKRQAKFFIYLSDVDAEAGPFTYVKGSQFGSPTYGNTFPQSLPLGSYPEIGAVEKTVAPESIVSALGKAGTVIFCDTAGLHRGGHAKSKSRFMFTAFYPSAFWTEPRFYKLSKETEAAAPSLEARYAMSH